MLSLNNVSKIREGNSSMSNGSKIVSTTDFIEIDFPESQQSILIGKSEAYALFDILGEYIIRWDKEEAAAQAEKPKEPVEEELTPAETLLKVMKEELEKDKAAKEAAKKDKDSWAEALEKQYIEGMHKILWDKYEPFRVTSIFTA